MGRIVSFVVFFSLLSTVLGSAHYYLYTRLFVAPALGPSFERSGAIICVLLTVAAPLLMIAGRFMPRERGRYYAALGFSWLGIMLLLMTSLGLTELLRMLPIDELLRARWSAVGVVAVVGAATIYGVATAIGTVAVKDVAVQLSRLPASMSGFRVVQLTDMHIGPMLGRSWVEKIVSQVNALEPDIVVITGDLVDGSVKRLREHVAPLGELRAKHGVYFVTGNHEYYSGADAWLTELRRLGVRPLRNERVSIGDGNASFDLAGVDDWRAFGQGHGRDLKKAVAGRDDDRELLLLAHQPKQVKEAAEHGVGLQLSGHTHGGQIFPWGFFVRAFDQPYLAGLSDHKGTKIYVSCGTGFWGPPMRIGAPAEITLLSLERGA